MVKRNSFFHKRRINVFSTDSPLPDYLPILGWAVFPKAKKRQPYHIHEETLEICYIAKGKVHWYTRGERYEIRRGNVFIVQPREVHGGVNMLMHPCEVYWLELDLSRYRAALTPELSEIPDAFGAIDKRYFPVDGSVQAIFREMIDECRVPGALSQQILATMFNRLMIDIQRSYYLHLDNEAQRRQVSGDRIAVAEQWLKAHLHENISVEDVAEACGLKISRFHQLFIAETGFTPLEYINRGRIDLAIDELRNTGRTITDIAFTVGFSSSQYFASVFKKYQGTTPSEFRARSR